MSRLDFYFDYACPWCYLGSMTVRELAASGVDVTYHVWKMPKDVPPPPPKPEDYFTTGRAKLKELRDELNVPLASPIQDNTVPALIATKVAQQMGAAEAYVKEVFHSHWGVKQDISDRSLLVELARKVGLDADAFGRALDEEQGKAAYEADLQAAVDLQITTIPSYLNGDKQLQVHHYDDMPSLDQLKELSR